MNHRQQITGRLVFVAVAFGLSAANCDATVGGGTVEIQAEEVTWLAKTPVGLSAVIVQADGEPIPDDYTVTARVDWKMPDDQTPITQEFAVSRSSPTIFELNATSDLAESARVGDLHWFVETSNGSLVGEESVPFQVDCPNLYTAELADIQATMLDKFGDLTTFDEIFEAGYDHNTHGNINIQGIGVSFIRFEPLDADFPSLIIFIEDGENADPTNPTLDEPLKFVGWGYPAAKGSSEPPTLGCVPYHEWFVHAAGWHTPSDGGMVVDPGDGPFGSDHVAAREFAGGLGATPDSYHPEVWDLHFWVDEEAGVPRLSIWNDPGGDKIPATGFLAADDTIFFYP